MALADTLFLGSGIAAGRATHLVVAHSHAQSEMHPKTLTVLTATITRATLDLFDKRTQRISTLVFIFPSTNQPFFLGASDICSLFATDPTLVDLSTLANN